MTRVKNNTKYYCECYRGLIMAEILTLKYCLNHFKEPESIKCKKEISEVPKFTLHDILVTAN